ncbi:hypothetical protein GU927_019320 [Rhodobacteraceae bacterium HSP-20]|uniref:ComEC/Rec2-related protein domain-containing protein n=1 Tax=Paragemmobacter amnigenus TaxID=2852097 RepID=A0ABS6J928_9RHOB|nr:hypothetical protein [Rhodobacter amnigenus]MBU9699997.1 hypothetical protein [Rhodobacter amnigenus]MBV4391224.1 hypothetical protein [Rhodobacter amnigenus]
MWDWISEKLGWLSMMPFVRPAVSLLLSIAAAVISYLSSQDNWAIVLLLLSLLLAVWSFAESFKGGISATIVGMLSAYYVTGLDTALTLLDRGSVTICVVFEHRSTQDCLDELLGKHGVQLIQ